MCSFTGDATQSVFGQGALIDFRDREPRPQIVNPGQALHAYRVKSLSVDAVIDGQVAQVQIAQEFQNTSNRTIEASFVFPVPQNGAIDRLTLMVGDQEYEAKLLPRDEARSIYEGYIRRNQDPALLEWLGSGMFRTSVFPIPPGQRRVVTIRYSQLCRQYQGLTEWTLPLRNAKYTSNALDGLKVNVLIKSEYDIKSVYSPTHLLGIRRPSDKLARVNLDLKKVIPSSDLQVFYDVGNQALGASVVSYRPNDKEDGYFLMLVAPKVEQKKEETIRKKVVFVIDRSGSMVGKSMEQAKEASKFVVNHLNEGDLFNIVAYDAEVESFEPELQAFSDKTRAQALSFIEGLFAGGSTNIDGAMSTALDFLKGDQLPGYVVFLTDGKPTRGETSIPKIVENMKQANASRNRICCFGVGYQVNSLLLDKLAREGFGQSVYVSPEEDIEEKVAQFYSRISSPVLTNVSINIEVDKQANANSPLINRVYPKKVYDVFAGDQMVLVGRYRHAGQAKVLVRGDVNGEKLKMDFPTELIKKSKGSKYAFVEKLWAVRRVGEIIDQIDLHGQDDELIDEMIYLSRKHGILTPYTSYLADENSDVRDLDVARRRVGAQLQGLQQQSGEFGFRQRVMKSALQSAGGMGGLQPSETTEAEDTPAALPALGIPGQSTRANGAVQFKRANAEKAEEVRNLRQIGTKSFYLEGDV
ncbi:MAG: VIT domain-containing protein, partial [Planctomycetota bacterium]|nr:VIT domain-containing protein [Planctomycetota bacterium]